MRLKDTDVLLAPKKEILVIDGELQKLANIHAAALQELLMLNNIPREYWNAVWHELSENPAWKEADDDLDIQWLMGWMRGVADALNTTERKLVRL
jgi:hypothetical protein